MVVASVLFGFPRARRIKPIKNYRRDISASRRTWHTSARIMKKCGSVPLFLFLLVVAVEVVAVEFVEIFPVVHLGTLPYSLSRIKAFSP
jgi:hypothetical protein